MLLSRGGDVGPAALGQQRGGSNERDRPLSRHEGESEGTAGWDGMADWIGEED